jgi:hypothetical protein
VSDHTDAPPELMPGEPCDCCGVPVSCRRGSMWHGSDRICRPCFWIWYDGNVDSTDPAAIRAERLRIYGQRAVP